MYFNQTEKTSFEIVGDGSLGHFQSFQFELSRDQIILIIANFFVVIPSDITQYWGIKYFATLQWGVKFY